MISKLLEEHKDNLYEVDSPNIFYGDPSEIDYARRARSVKQKYDPKSPGFTDGDFFFRPLSNETKSVVDFIINECQDSIIFVESNLFYDRLFHIFYVENDSLTNHQYQKPIYSLIEKFPLIDHWYGNTRLICSLRLEKITRKNFGQHRRDSGVPFLLLHSFKGKEIESLHEFKGEITTLSTVGILKKSRGCYLFTDERGRITVDSLAVYNTRNSDLEGLLYSHTSKRMYPLFTPIYEDSNELIELLTQPQYRKLMNHYKLGFKVVTFINNGHIFFLLETYSLSSMPEWIHNYPRLIQNQNGKYVFLFYAIAKNSMFFSFNKYNIKPLPSNANMGDYDGSFYIDFNGEYYFFFYRNNTNELQIIRLENIPKITDLNYQGRMEIQQLARFYYSFFGHSSKRISYLNDLDEEYYFEYDFYTRNIFSHTKKSKNINLK